MLLYHPSKAFTIIILLACGLIDWQVRGTKYKNKVSVAMMIDWSIDSAIPTTRINININNILHQCQLSQSCLYRPGKWSGKWTVDATQPNSTTECWLVDSSVGFLILIRHQHDWREAILLRYSTVHRIEHVRKNHSIRINSIRFDAIRSV